MEGMIANPNDVELNRCTARTDDNRVTKREVKRFHNVGVDDDFVSARGHPAFRVSLRHPHTVGVGVFWDAVPQRIDDVRARAVRVEHRPLHDASPLTRIEGSDG